MRLRVTILGTEILLLEATRTDPAEVLADAITDLQQSDDEEQDELGAQYGVSHAHLERSPETDDWGEDKFGFRETLR
jgi:hypothetical protein